MIKIMGESILEFIVWKLTNLCNFEANYEFIAKKEVVCEMCLKV